MHRNTVGVMLVSERSLDANVLHDFLENESSVVLCHVPNVVSFLRYMELEQYGILLLNMDMPCINQELVRTICHIHNRPAIIAFGASADNDVVGTDGFLQTPIDTDELWRNILRLAPHIDTFAVA